MNGQQINNYAKKITTNQLFQATLVILGVIFTASTIINNHYSIKLNKARIREEEAKLKNNS